MYHTSTQGTSLIEVIVVTALIPLVFFALIAGFQSSLTVLLHTKAKAGAVALANEQIEYIRALPYDSVGTVSGIPFGTILQNQTKNLNGLPFSQRTLIQYVDAPEDGLGASDVNGITADYKRAKVELSWSVRGATSSLSLVTNIVPKGLESLAGGGTLVVNVFDATAAPVENAAVRVVNASTSPPIDVIANSNAAGQVMFPGAPAGGGYELSVSKSEYSGSQTYNASSTNPNPNPPHVAVATSTVSTVNFSIDRVSSLLVRTVEPPTTSTTEDLFDDASTIALFASTTLLSGDIVLGTTTLGYEPIGEVYATGTAPMYITSWGDAEVVAVVPALTTVRYRVYSVDGAGVRTMIPDALLPGNSTGFTTTSVNLGTVPAVSYPRLALGATLESTDGTATPRIERWSLSYQSTNTPVPNIPVSFRGNKNIGTDGGGQPVYKYETTHTTSATGTVHIGNLEWDQYEVTVAGASGYDVSDACPPLPLTIQPNTSTTSTLILSPHTTRSLRVQVFGTGGVPLSGASVRLTRSGYDTTKTTSACGSSFFNSLSAASDYTLETSKSGYTTDTLTNVDISGTHTLTIILSP